MFVLLLLVIGLVFCIVYFRKKSIWLLCFNLISISLTFSYKLTKMGLASQNLALRIDYDHYLFSLSVIAFLLGIVVNILYIYEDTWLEKLVLGFGLVVISSSIFVAFSFYYAFGAISEYETVKENGKTYVLAGESLGLHHYFRHKYEVVSKYLRYAKPIDYDIDHLSERVYDGKSYEEYFDIK
ncbi:hypothetical protein SAMN05216400_1536 [Streptococcus equinus]|uniref:Uncharacterized protein n=2 Tax=Streptococcus equinus TaxID=1335 RepID=A0A1G9MPK5_STREI|nr:hypothetical protein SAMN05216400_1536 [Streptococcus equinus]